MILMIAGASHTGKLLLAHGNAIEQRLDNSMDKEVLMRENEQNLRLCRERGCHCILLEDDYEIRVEDAFG